MNKFISNYLLIVLFISGIAFIGVENRNKPSTSVNENTVVNIPESAIETSTTTSTTTTTISTSTTTSTTSTTTTVFRGEVKVKLTCTNVVSTNNKTAYANFEIEIENTTNNTFSSRIEIKPGSRVINLMAVKKGIRTTQVQKFEYDIINLNSTGKGYFAAYLYEEGTDKVIDNCFFDRQMPTTTTTSTTTLPNKDENYGNTIFKTREEYHEHILNLNFYDGYRGYEGDFVINNGYDGKNWDCSTANNARGCRSFYEFFPWVSGLNFSLPNSGGNRAFGEIDITIPNDHQILSVGVDLVACRSLDLNCARSNEGEYLVHLSNFNYTYRNFKDLPQFYIDLVGREKSIGVDQSFFYSGYYYFLKNFTISFIDESDPLRWQGTLDFRIVPGVGTYVWQVGWDGPYNVGWLNPSYNFIYASLDTYQNTPYFSP